MCNRSRLLAASALALALAYPAFGADPAPQPRVSDEISALKARLEQLETRQKLEEQQRQQAAIEKDRTATSQQLAREAESHDQLLVAEGFTAGYADNRFVIQSNDGNFSLRPWLQFQFRGVAMQRNDFQVREGGPTDQRDLGFEVRRMKFGFDGNVFSPDMTYLFQWATGRTSGNSTVRSSTGTTVGTVSNGLGGVPVLEEAWVKYHFPTTPFSLKVGQLKDPILHDQIVSSKYQLSTDRSVTADIFANGDAFTQGIMFIYDPNSEIRFEGGINEGIRSANTNFLTYPNNGGFNSYNYGLAGRVEYKAMGTWKDYAQMSAVGIKQPLLVAGFGADYSERGRAGQLVAAADLHYADPSGFSFYGAFVDRYSTHNYGIPAAATGVGASFSTPDPAVAGRPTNEYSILLQAGYLIDQKVEPFARYEYMRLQGTPAGSQNNIQIITAGVNYYIYGNRLKLTGQVVWLPEGLPIDVSSNDLLTNTKGAEITFIAQLQLLL